MSAELVNVQGMAQLQEFLDTLAPKLQQNILRGALRAGAKVIQAKAREVCPIEPASAASTYKATLGWTPGALQKSIRLSAKLTGNGAVAFVKAGNKQAYYAHMVEFGTATHWIRPKHGRSLLIAGINKEAVQHPGARKNPFMRVAMDSQAQAAVVRVRDYIAARLTKEGINLPDDGGTDTS